MVCRHIPNEGEVEGVEKQEAVTPTELLRRHPHKLATHDGIAFPIGCLVPDTWPGHFALGGLS